MTFVSHSESESPALRAGGEPVSQAHPAGGLSATVDLRIKSSKEVLASLKTSVLGTRELPSKLTAPDFDNQAWLGDAWLALNVKHTLIECEGKVNQQWFADLTGAVFQCQYLIRVGYHLPNGPGHASAQSFEYLYQTDAPFRERFHLDTGIRYFPLPGLDRGSNSEQAGPVLSPSGSGFCWKRLFVGPTIEGPFQFINEPVVTKRQLVQLAKVNPLVPGRKFRLTEVNRLAHVELGGLMTAKEVIDSMAGTWRLGLEYGQFRGSFATAPGADQPYRPRTTPKGLSVSWQSSRPQCVNDPPPKGYKWVDKVVATTTKVVTGTKRCWRLEPGKQPLPKGSWLKVWEGGGDAIVSGAWRCWRTPSGKIKAVPLREDLYGKILFLDMPVVEEKKEEKVARVLERVAPAPALRRGCASRCKLSEGWCSKCHPPEALERFLYGTSPSTPSPVDSFRNAREQRSQRWAWLFDRLDKRVRAQRFKAQQQAMAAAKLDRGVELLNSNDNPFAALEEVILPAAKCANFFAGVARLERKTPRKGVKNMSAVRWQARCLERKLRLASLPHERKRIDKLRLLTLRCPESEDQVKSWVDCVFGRTVSKVDFIRLALDARRVLHCPRNGFIVKWERGSLNVSSAPWLRGCFFMTDKKLISHIGDEASAKILQGEGARGVETRLRVQKNYWKAALLLLLRKEQEQKKVLAKKVYSIAHVSVPCVKPNIVHFLVNGFTVQAKFQGFAIFARGFTFSRPDDRPGRDGLLFVRQDAFWHSDKRLVFTPKGLAKIFFQKRNQERWREALAHGLGLTLERATALFAQFKNDPEMPDVTVEEVGNELPYAVVKAKTVRFLNLDNVKEKGGMKEKGKAPEVSRKAPPVPPPLPTTPPSPESPRVRESLLANGDAWLREPAERGVANRALFRDTFPDWRVRVSDAALALMNQDLSKQGDYKAVVRQPGETLIVDPSRNFNIFDFSRPKQRSEGSSPPSPVDQLLSEIRRRAGRPVNLKEKEKEWKETRRRGPWSRSAASVEAGQSSTIQDQFKLSRGSEQSDIEENPGPSLPQPEIVFSPGTPSPGGEASNIIAYYGFNQEDETIAMNFMMARNADQADIEENPGPSDHKRGFSESDVRGRSETSISDIYTRASERSVSRSRSPLRRLAQKIGLATSTIDEIKEKFGIHQSVSLAEYKGPLNEWVKRHYEYSFQVSHLPSDVEWQINMPLPVWSKAAFCAQQHSLDRLSRPNSQWSSNAVGLALERLEKKLQSNKDHGDKVLDGYFISALAHEVKTRVSCPNDSHGYAIEIMDQRAAQNGIVILFHYSEFPVEEEIKNHLWWVVNGWNMLHGATFSSSSLGLSFSTTYRRAKEMANQDLDDFLVRYRLSEEQKARLVHGVDGFLGIPSPPNVNRLLVREEGEVSLASKEMPFLYDLFLDFNDDTLEDELMPASYLVWFYFLLYNFVSIYTNYIHSFMYPDLHSRSLNLTEGEFEIPENTTDLSDTLLVAQLGTHGDKIPVAYYANLAATFGVKTHLHCFHDINTEELENLGDGDMFTTLPGYSNLMNSVRLGYKRVFVPHIEVAPSEGVTYSLSPSSRWIETVSFVSDWARVKWWNVIPAYITNRFIEVFNPTWRIGCLSDSHLPRSADGLTLLKKRENQGVFEHGWTSGSAKTEVIPEEVRASCPEIPKGDHNQIFTRYKNVHIHGGAGTVQTAIACGANPIVHDKRLDRKYHRLPTPKDFRQPSVSPFMGWLVWSGFDVEAPFLIKAIWLVSFLWDRKFSMLCQLAYNLAKAYTIGSYLYQHWAFALILLFTIPAVLWRVLWRQKSLFWIAKSVAISLWEFPLFCLLESKTAFVLAAASMRKFWIGAFQDYSNAKEHRTSLVFEPVHRNGLEFVFPFGHWSLRDELTQEVYEGAFLPGSNNTIGSLFQFRKTKRPMKPGAKVFPAPFNILTARQMTKAEPKAYGAYHNCSTLVLKPLWSRGIFWSMVAVSVSASIALALQPPEFLIKISNLLFPGHDVDKTPLFEKFGFAAGIQGVPFELEEEQLATDNLPKVHEEERTLEALKSEDSLKGLIAEINLLQNTVRGFDLATLDDEDIQEVAERTFAREMEKVQDSIDPMVQILDVPPYVKYTWAQVVDAIHEGLSFLRQNELISSFIAKLKVSAANIAEFIIPVLEMLSRVLHLAWKISEHYFNKLFSAVCALMDYVWGLKASKRVKTVWGLTGIHKTGVVGAAMRLALATQFAELEGRTTFLNDYSKFCEMLKDFAKQENVGYRNRVGGPQRRPVKYSKPLMSKGEAELLGFKPGEYVTEKEYQERVDSYLEFGTAQGADGVFLADKNPELIAKSQHRYEPKYADLSPADRLLAEEIAQALVDQYPHVYKDCQVVPMKSVQAYIKPKYSPGTPFIGDRGFKTRQAMFDAGYDKVLRKAATEYLQSGKYPVQFYHAFVKSQVVDIKKCLPVSMGGKDKDVRTVVSQDMFTYFMDQCFQIERNKRRVWDTFGAGIGMPLNQSMEQIFSEMRDLQKERGGRYIIADGTAFDSYCKPFLTEVNYHLWRYGFKDHPSGNGEAIASVLKASYDARQNAWIIGITEPEYDKLIISIPDHDTRKMIEHRNPKNVVPLADFIDFSVFNKLNHQQQLDYVKNLELPGGKVLVSWRSDLRPKNANWMGEFRFDPNPSTNTDVLQYQTFKYTPDNFEGMYQDIKALGEGDIKLLSNVHAKNRGGSTGGSDTSNLNTNMFKAGIIRAWCLTMNRPPKEFFKYNSLKNTSDDTIWQTGGQFGLNTIEQVEQFKHHAAEVGIHLTIETTKDISQVEYLSKFVRVPTAEDSAALKIWRQHKIRSIQQAHKAMGYTVPTTFEELNNPRFVVVQNPTAILLRRSAFRYYQSNARTWRYVSVERGAGHAQNTAFVPELYAKFAKEWCDDVNNLLVEHGIHRKFRYHPGNKDSNLLPFVEQIDPRASQQALSPRQQAFLNWLKGNMYPSYLKVLNVHMNVQSPDPLYHEKLLRKLSRGWRGWSEIMAEGVDGLFAATDSIPDEWSKKFNGQIEMLYAEVPFYTRNKYIEKYVYLKMLEHSTPEELTYSDFTSVLAEGPYAGACDAHHFWETIRNKEECERLLEEDVTKYQGLVMFISALYAFLSPIEWAIMGVPFLGSLYKLYVWNFVGLNKVYGIMNTLYWHSTGRSSREISRIQPRDPYIVSKQFCAFLVDFLPPQAGYLMTFPIILLSLLPKLLEAISKAWYVGGEIKQDKGHTPNSQTENLWSRYSDDYVEKLRASPTRKAYIAAETGTGKSTWWIAALWAARHRQKIRKIWLVEPRKILRDETIIPFGIPSQKLKKGVEASVSTDVYICTYGHLQSRLHDMDPEHDIVLFDEFHELQGEMILGLHTVKAPIFLLSATPVDIPALEGSPFLTPEIKRRFPTVIHECDDGLSPLDMFMMAKNKYPELCDRALIIVPTLKEVDKLYNSLEYLRVGKISKLSSKDRKPAEEGIIISTPYVQAGFDLKPPPKILIDSGRDVVVDQGVLVRPFPWTSKDVNKQRAGRVSRLQPGVIYRPRKAGTGQRPIQYPSPELFRHKVVAEHFKVPQLCPVPRPEITEMPYFMIDHSKVSKISIRKSVTMVHAIALSGVREDQLEVFYNRRVRGFAFDEDHEFLNRVYNNPRWSKVPLIPWDEVKYHYHRQNVTFYAFGNENDPTIRAMGPIKAVKGQWVEMLADVPPEEIKPVDREEVTAFFDNLASRFSRVQNTIVKHLDSMSHELASQVAAI